MWKEATSFIREFGFPIFVVVWFMWRMEKRLDRFLELLTALMRAVALLAKSVEQSVSPESPKKTASDGEALDGDNE